MRDLLSSDGARRYPLGLLLLLLTLGQPSMAAGMGSPEALAQAFAAAYRRGDAEAVVALQGVTGDTAAAVAQRREQARRLWRRQMAEWQLRGFRVMPLLGRDQPLPAGAMLPGKKLLVEYGGASGTARETYLIAQQNGLYYLLSPHGGQ